MFFFCVYRFEKKLTNFKTKTNKIYGIHLNANKKRTYGRRISVRPLCTTDILIAISN